MSNITIGFIVGASVTLAYMLGYFTGKDNDIKEHPYFSLGEGKEYQEFRIYDQHYSRCDTTEVRFILYFVEDTVCFDDIYVDSKYRPSKDRRKYFGLFEANK